MTAGHRKIGLVAALILFLISGLGLFNQFYGSSNRHTYERIPIQKSIDIDLECRKGSTFVSYEINAHREEGYIAVDIIGSSKDIDEGFPFADCKKIRFNVRQMDIDYFSLISAPTGVGRQRIEIDESLQEIVKLKDWNEIDPTRFTKKDTSIMIYLPVNDFLTRTGLGRYDLDLKIKTNLVRTGETTPLLPGSIELHVEDKFVVDKVSPKLAKLPDSKKDSIFSIQFENEKISRTASYQLNEGEKSRFDLLNKARLLLTISDPNSESRRDLWILLLSTLFGVSVSFLFEYILNTPVTDSKKLGTTDVVRYSRLRSLSQKCRSMIQGLYRYLLFKFSEGKMSLKNTFERKK